NKIWLEREKVEGFEVDDAIANALSDEFLAKEKPLVPPEGYGKNSGKKKRKNKAATNADIWLKNS
ncbi:MAG: hypothetical protein JKX76_08710, partial [Colwellia sp.]|nr:hypothetical protein [Colwellia sp.]